jgi:pyruvate, orthophosphate dikinase
MSYITDQKHDPAHPRGAAPNGYVFDFDDGRASIADLLDGKGANLTEMTWLGLPVPPGS